MLVGFGFGSAVCDPNEPDVDVNDAATGVAAGPNADVELA